MINFATLLKLDFVCMVKIIKQANKRGVLSNYENRGIVGYYD